jgi:hypothetical protein
MGSARKSSRRMKNLVKKQKMKWFDVKGNEVRPEDVRGGTEPMWLSLNRPGGSGPYTESGRLGGNFEGLRGQQELVFEEGAPVKAPSKRGGARPGAGRPSTKLPELETEYDGKMEPVVYATNDRGNRLVGRLRDHFITGYHPAACFLMSGHVYSYQETAEDTEIVDGFLPSEVGGEWKDPPEETHKIGDRFLLRGIHRAECVLAQVDAGVVCLIGLESGNRITDPEKVDDIFRVSETTLQRLAGPSCGPAVKVRA